VYLLLEQLPQVLPAVPVLTTVLRSITDSGAMNVVVRIGIAMETLHPSIASAVREADPSLPVIGLRAMDDVISSSLRRPRMMMHLFGGFASITLLIAAVGVYGLLSYLVTQRRSEIGIRMALGAKRGEVLRMVMAQAGRLAIAGVVVGLAAAIMASRVLRSQLFEITPTDTFTYLVVALSLLGVSMVASWIPARRAARIDPLTALRHD
jgi:ABC-type antimicrobial peptide transport system permease subunit